ncbi:MAG: NifU family protein [Ndongobacter sp.]|nr:NifU family protein [Ndongobacter sp.]
MYDELEKVLDEYVRPLLKAHGGDMQVLDFTDGILRFKLQGQCSGCPAADLTTEELIQGELAEHMPEVKQAVLVNEVNEDLMNQARELLKMRHEQ